MRYFFSCFLLLLITTTCVPFASASTLTLLSNQTNLRVGDVFFVDILLDTQGETINATEIDVLFPSALVSFVKAEDVNSLISLWIQRPTLKEESVVGMSGVTPGGVKGQGLLVARLYFEVQKEGQESFSVARQQVLLHDGKGTPASVSVSEVHIAVTPGDAVYNERAYLDSEPPEPFTVLRHTDPDVFDGHPFLVFETQDKNSGILKYQVKEGRFSRYSDAVSPYRLIRQEEKHVYVKAIDRAGNEIVSPLYPQDDGVWSHHRRLIFSILIVFISLCLLFFLYHLRRGKK